MVFSLNEERIIPNFKLGIAFNAPVEGSLVQNTQTTSTQALTFNTPYLLCSPTTKLLSRGLLTNLSPISAVKFQNKEELKNLFKNHLRELTECTNKSAISLQAAIESVFKRNYSRPRKEFDKLAFQSGAIMTGKEPREEHKRKQADIWQTKHHIEENKRKRVQNKTEAAALEKAFLDTKILDPELKKNSFFK